LILIVILASLTFLTISQACGESLSGSGLIQASVYGWYANGEFVVGKPIDINLRINIPMPSNIVVFEIDFSGCGVNNAYDLRYSPHTDYGDYTYNCEVVPSEAGQLSMSIIIGFNCSAITASTVYSQISGNTFSVGRGLIAGEITTVFIISGESSVSLSAYNALKSQYDILKSQYDSLNTNYQNLQAENSDLQTQNSYLQLAASQLRSLIVAIGIIAVIGFILYFIERGKPKLPKPTYE